MVMDLLTESFFDRIGWKTTDGKQTISLSLIDQHAQIEIADDLSGMCAIIDSSLQHSCVRLVLLCDLTSPLFLCPSRNVHLRTMGSGTVITKIPIAMGSNLAEPSVRQMIKTQLNDYLLSSRLNRESVLSLS